MVEAGLGGERDATNVTRPESAALAVITPIGLEHEDVLGALPSRLAWRLLAGALHADTAWVLHDCLLCLLAGAGIQSAGIQTAWQQAEQAIMQDRAAAPLPSQRLTASWPAGRGLTAIARAKAGIMKPGRPVLIAAQPEPEAEQVSRALGCLPATGARPC